MPIKKETLRKRKWPLPSFPIGSEVFRKEGHGSSVVFYDEGGRKLIPKRGKKYSAVPYPENYPESCYLSEGSVAAIPLPFPPGECAVTSLVKDDKGKIFGATTGEKSHLFSYDSAQNSFVELGKIANNCLKASLAISSDGKLFIATKLTSGEGCIYFFDSNKTSFRIKKLVCPIKGEGVSTLAIDNNLRLLYGLSSKTGTFFLCDLKKGLVESKGPVDKNYLFSETLIVSGNGDVFGGARWTQLFRYRPKGDCLTILETRAPVIKGREMYNRIEDLLWDEKTGSIYGGTSADGILFRFFPDEERMVSIGKVLNQPRIRCLTIGKDGCIYGI
ncbi:MAG: hypothetical protein PHI59_03025, partial [Candidatus Omnitrophica bacterium]|nr:hypothetical protein [Candidatus Omnitrophota bacterium]